MNMIVANVLKSRAAEAHTDAAPLNIVALLCCVGLLASLCMATLGFDISGGTF